MRDPFERLVSHYWHNVRDVVRGGALQPLSQAVKERTDYLAFSDYAMQLAPHLDQFGSQPIYTLPYKASIEDPQHALDQRCRWLGLPPARIARSPLDVWRSTRDRLRSASSNEA